GELTVRADSGFFSCDLLDRLDAHEVRWSAAIPQYAHVKAAIAAIPEKDWAPIGYPEGGEAHVAETTLVAGGRGERRRLRLVIRRTRLAGAAQQQLWPDWCHHAFVTNRGDLDTAAADKFHRAHATVELAIRDLKENAELQHLPSGSFNANAAWLACAALAHNLFRWLNHHSGARRGRLTVGRTVRNQLLAVPGRLVNCAGRRLLRLPARWPWETAFHNALTGIRALPRLC
ncbi:MAG: transposase, partial [bacterium]|nr:transposase [bacterium]